MVFFQRIEFEKKLFHSDSRRTTKIDDTFNMKRCISWFKRYCTPEDPDMLAPEGMERFCKDIEVDPENIVMLGKNSSFPFSKHNNYK